LTDTAGAHRRRAIAGYAALLAGRAGAARRAAAVDVGFVAVLDGVVACRHRAHAPVADLARAIGARVAGLPGPAFVVDPAAVDVAFAAVLDAVVASRRLALVARTDAGDAVG